jgi:hypothetical protein
MRIGSTDACIRPLGKLMLAHADLQLLDSIVKNQGLPALVAETITSWRNFDRNWRRFVATVLLEPKGRTPSAWTLRNSGLRFSPADLLCNFRSLSADRCQ